MGMMGLALAIVGLYGLVAYAASRRTKEIGIRMAIGAGRSDVLRMVLGQGMVLAIAGLGVGLLASAARTAGLARCFPAVPAATAEPMSWRSCWSRQRCWWSRCSRPTCQPAARRASIPPTRCGANRTGRESPQPTRASCISS